MKQRIKKAEVINKGDHQFLKIKNDIVATSDISLGYPIIPYYLTDQEVYIEVTESITSYYDDTMGQIVSITYCAVTNNNNEIIIRNLF